MPDNKYTEPAKDKCNRDFDLVVKALDFCLYVEKITANNNKFPVTEVTERTNPDGTKTQVIVEHDDSLVKKAREQAYEIYVLIFSANDIDLRKYPEQKTDRLGKQSKAIELCREHCATILLCGRHFHLPGKKVANWTKLTRDVLVGCEGWHASDKVRYKNI